MEEKGLSISILFHRAIQGFYNHWILLIFTSITAWIVFSLSTVIELYLDKPSPIIVALLEILETLLGAWVFLGLLKIYLKIVKGKKPEFLDLFRGFPMILNYIVSQILLILTIFTTIATIFFVLIGPFWIHSLVEGYDVTEWLTWLNQLPRPYDYFSSWISFVGITLFLAPIFWLFVRFLMMPFFIVDYYEGPIEALKMSYKATKGVFWDLLSLVFVSIILIYLGFVVFGIGLTVAFPITYLMLAYAYYELVETTNWAK